MVETDRLLEIDEKNLMSRLRQIVELESPSKDPDAVNKVVDVLEAGFRAAGATTSRIRCEGFGDHFRAEWGQGPEQILILGHMDTVWPVGEIKRRPFTLDGTIARGPGIDDMKSGLLVALMALEKLHALKLTTPLKLVFLFNSDEELGSISSRPYIEKEAAKSKYCLVFEPGNYPDQAVKTARRGVGRFKVDVTGVGAHAGNDFKKGRSAIVEMGHLILDIAAMTNMDRDTSVSVGLISGGSLVNNVAAHAEAHVDLRVTTKQEADRVTDAMYNLSPHTPDVTIKVSGGLSRPVYERTKAVEELYLKAKGFARELGFDLPETSSGGASDGNWTAAMGVPTLDGLGMVGDGAHAESEFTDISHTARRVALVAAIYCGLR